jgi:hypothetical protein
METESFSIGVYSAEVNIVEGLGLDLEAEANADVQAF